MVFKVHEFESEQEAKEKVALVDELMGLPNGGDTLTIAIPFEHNGKWYINADEEYSHLVGGITEITVE